MGKHSYHKLPTDIQAYLDEHSGAFIHFTNHKRLPKRLKSQYKRHGYVEYIGADFLVTMLYYWQAVIELHYPEKTNKDGLYYKDLIQQMIFKREMGESIDEYSYILKSLPQIVQHQYVKHARGLLRQSLVFYLKHLSKNSLLDEFLSRIRSDYQSEKVRHRFYANRLIEHCDNSDDQTLWSVFAEMAPTFWI